jgi:hypothetical protein
MKYLSWNNNICNVGYTNFSALCTLQDAEELNRLSDTFNLNGSIRWTKPYSPEVAEEAALHDNGGWLYWTIRDLGNQTLIPVLTALQLLAGQQVPPRGYTWDGRGTRSPT